MTEHHPKAVEILRRLGIDPARLDERIPPFDLVAFRLEQAERNLAKRPGEFENAKATHPVALDWVRRYIEAPTKVGSLLLSGRTGRGKTWEAWGIIGACAEGLAAMGRGCYWKTISHPTFNAAMRPGGDISGEAVLDDLMNIDLLVFDDISAGLNTGWTAENLYRLVNHRWEHRKPTIYSTNLPPADLAQAVGDRVLSRLSAAERIVMGGPDRRANAA
uniref:ATP-binding protein n=1 Tax=Paractinoplanes polyasparticus TaxID=2856853 RepID=UPI001C85A8DB|nr:ATP-binding protein [Actinoplanes polyasparticus]